MTTEKDLYRKKNVYRETSQYPHFSLLKNATCIMIWDKNLRQNILQKAVFLPSMRTEENNANILEAIYYHRDKKDRKPKHTMLFCTSTVLCENLLSTINDAEDVSYGKQYISTNEYPAITILRSYNEHDDKYSRAEFEYGNAKVKVMVKKEGNIPCFDHLVGTEPQSLPNKINLIG